MLLVLFSMRCMYVQQAQALIGHYWAKVTEE